MEDTGQHDMGEEAEDPLTFTEWMNFQVELATIHVMGRFEHEMNVLFYGEDYLERRRNPPT